MSRNMDRCEEEAARLLPWYVTGSLAAGDSERVARHLEHCAICRADLEHERSVLALLKSDARMEYAPQPGLSNTLERIDALVNDATNASRAIATRGTARWLAAAVVVQAIGLGVLGGYLYLRPAAPARYGTLSVATPVPSGPALRAVFASSMTLEQLKALLAAQELTIVRGPSDAGAYTLASTAPDVSAKRLASIVGALRLDPRALFVEPVYDASAAPP
jgi:hypothetical protein